MLFFVCCFIMASTVNAANIESNDRYNFDNNTVFLAKTKSKTTAGNETEYRINSFNTANNKLSCGELLDSETKKMLREALWYPRVIVPVIIIVLGSIDLFKAVIAGKEDEMKKAQKTLVKRVIIGVLVFLVPVLIDVIIWLAEIAWQGLGYGEPCGL